MHKFSSEKKAVTQRVTQRIPYAFSSFSQTEISLNSTHSFCDSKQSDCSIVLKPPRIFSIEFATTNLQGDPWSLKVLHHVKVTFVEEITIEGFQKFWDYCGRKVSGVFLCHDTCRVLID